MLSAKCFSSRIHHSECFGVQYVAQDDNMLDIKPSNAPHEPQPPDSLSALSVSHCNFFSYASVPPVDPDCDTPSSIP